MDQSQYIFPGNAAFMELYNALKVEVGPVKAAEAAAQVYERCGNFGHLVAR